MESTAATTKLIEGIDKFAGIEFVVRQRTLHTMANLVHPHIIELPDGQLRPESLYRTRRGCDRPATRGVTISRSALADALEDESPTPTGEGGGGGTQREEVTW